MVRTVNARVAPGSPGPFDRAALGQVAARLRSGTVGHNAMRTDFGVSFGGYKESGILEGHPDGYENTAL